jgi:hypothetical protein
MSVLVYPRLGEVLASKNVTIPELERTIQERFGLSIQPEALYGLLLDEEPLGQVDLQVVGAAAAALDVALDDLFAVETAPNGAGSEANNAVLGAQDSRRLAQLFDKQGQESLSDTESEELRALVATYRHLLHERRLAEIAEQRGASPSSKRAAKRNHRSRRPCGGGAFSADPQRRQSMVD